MAEHFNLGVYQLDNGNWAWRFTKTIDGKRVNRKGTKDVDGNVLRSQKAAIRARELALMTFEAKLNEVPKHRMTVQEVFEEYCEKGRKGKAFQTIRKQDSLWENHLQERFGNRFIDDISVAEINDYLTELYYVDNRAYKYVESFLKMFYLIFGQAYSRGYLELDKYNKLCLTKDARISMPKMKVDEDRDIVSYSKDDVEQLCEYFHDTNAETAFMLGYHCGLRINECYGLKWDNIDLEKGTIIIDRQMQYQNGLIKIVSLKTRNARRTIYMSQKLKDYLTKLKRQQDTDSISLSEQRKQNQTIITDLDGSSLSCLKLVNCLPNGKIQTVNSMKFHSKTIKEKLGIDFKFHNLRHTYGTRLAELNTPTHLLCNQMGHASGKITQQYYLGVSKQGIDILSSNLNQL